MQSAVGLKEPTDVQSEVNEFITSFLQDSARRLLNIVELRRNLGQSVAGDKEALLLADFVLNLADIEVSH